MKFIVYQDAAGEWRWHLQSAQRAHHRRGRRGYKRRAMAVKRLNAFLAAILDGEFR